MKKLVIIAVILLTIGAGTYVILSQLPGEAKTSSVGLITPAVTEPIVSSTKIGDSYTFDAINIKDQSKSDLGVSFTDAELRSQIKFKGEPLNPPKGKAFLLLRVEMDNSTPERVVIQIADFIRIKKQEKLYAPDYHNGNVLVDPVATKNDQIVFIVDKDLSLYNFSVGDPAGEKQELTIKF